MCLVSLECLHINYKFQFIYIQEFLILNITREESRLVMCIYDL